MLDSPVQRQAQQALAAALADVTGWQQARTPGVLIATALPEVFLVEYAAFIEDCQPQSLWSAGIAWYWPGHGWCALDMDTDLNHDGDVTTWPESAHRMAGWVDRVRVLLNAVVSDWSGPFPTALDLCQDLFHRCAQEHETSWWTDGEGTVHWVPVRDDTRVDTFASHDMCPHLRAVTAALRLLPTPERSSALTVLALQDGARAAAVTYLLGLKPSLVSEPRAVETAARQ